MVDGAIVLVGMMGAGKSVVGRLVARRLDCAFVDADDAVEARAGRPIPQIFADDGEDRFRDLETAVLADLVDTEQRVVVAAGGGAVVRPDNRELLRRRATVVWLRAPVEELVERVGKGSGRPLLAEDPQRALTALEAQRAPWYAATAHVVVDTARRRPHEVAAEVVGSLSAPAVEERR